MYYPVMREHPRLPCVRGAGKNPLEFITLKTNIDAVSMLYRIRDEFRNSNTMKKPPTFELAACCMGG
jgi:hypothetical protein